MKRKREKSIDEEKESKLRKEKKIRKVRKSRTKFFEIVRDIPLSDCFGDIRKEFLSKYIMFEEIDLLLPFPYCYADGGCYVSDQFKPFVVKNFEDVCKLVFTKNNIFNPYKRRGIERFIKRTWRKKQLEEMLNRHLEEDDSPIPKLYTRQIEYLLFKLCGLDIDSDKRSIEKENLEVLDKRIFIKLCNILIPEDIMIEILSYFEQGRKYVDNVGLISENFYLLCLKSWKFISIHQKNIYTIPLLVLQNAKTIVFNTHSVFKQEFHYFIDNAKAVQKLLLKGDKKEKNFFNGLVQKKVVMVNVVKLSVTNVYGLKIRKNSFPNCKKFVFREYVLPKVKKPKVKRDPITREVIGTTKPKKILKLELTSETREFLETISYFKFDHPEYASRLGWRRLKKEFPSFLFNLKNLKSFWFHPFGFVGDLDVWKEITKMKNLSRIKFEDEESHQSGNYVKIIRERNLKFETISVIYDLHSSPHYLKTLGERVKILDGCDCYYIILTFEMNRDSIFSFNEKNDDGFRKGKVETKKLLLETFLNFKFVYESVKSSRKRFNRRCRKVKYVFRRE